MYFGCCSSPMRMPLAGTSSMMLMPPHHKTRKSELWPFSVISLSSRRIYGWVGGLVAGRVNVLWMMFFPNEDAGTSSMTLTIL